MYIEKNHYFSRSNLNIIVASCRGVMDESGEQFVAYFLPLEETLEKRRRDFTAGIDYAQNGKRIQLERQKQSFQRIRRELLSRDKTRRGIYMSALLYHVL